MRRAGTRGDGGRRGFTLVELLVVIVIIGVLASLALVGATAAIRSSKMKATEALIGALRSATNSYAVYWGDYPPTSLSELGLAHHNGVNSGIECLCASLSSDVKVRHLWEAPQEDQYCNMDGDEADGNLTRWWFGDSQLREIRDAFGRPLVYYHFRDYAKADPRLSTYRSEIGGEDAVVPAQKGGAGPGGYLSPGGFQIFSTDEAMQRK